MANTLPLFDREPDQARSDTDRHVRSRRQADTTQRVLNPLIRTGEIAANGPTGSTIIHTSQIYVTQQMMAAHGGYGTWGGG